MIRRSFHRKEANAKLRSEIRSNLRFSRCPGTRYAVTGASAEYWNVPGVRAQIPVRLGFQAYRFVYGRGVCIVHIQATLSPIALLELG